MQCQRALALKVQGTDVGRAWTLFLKRQSSCINWKAVCWQDYCQAYLASSKKPENAKVGEKAAWWGFLVYLLASPLSTYSQSWIQLDTSHSENPASPPGTSLHSFAKRCRMALTVISACPHSSPGGLLSTHHVITQVQENEAPWVEPTWPRSPNLHIAIDISYKSPRSFQRFSKGQSGLQEAPFSGKPKAMASHRDS